MTRTFDVDARRARLARRHRLLPDERTDDVAAIADDLVALHSSDPVSVYLSAAVRMRVPSLEAVEKALYDDRTVLRHHGMRRTLWVATPEVVRLMHAAATRKLVGPEQRRTTKLLAASGVQDPLRWLAEARAQVLEALAAAGPLTARQLGERVPALRVPLRLGEGTTYATTTSAHSRVLLQLGFEGHVLRGRPTGSWVNGQYAYAAAASWVTGGVEGGEPLGEREAAAALADRWLRRFGPAAAADLQWWTGWTATLTRHALEDCGAEPVLVQPRPGEEPASGWVAAGDDADGPPQAGEPWVALLPGLDPTTMGWKERGWYLDPACAEAFDRNGNAGPTIWADGRVVGAWAQAPDGSIRLHYFVEVRSAATRDAVQQEARRLEGLLGETRFTVRFPGRIHARLVT